MRVREGHPKKALTPIFVTDGGIIEMENPAIKVLLFVSIMALHPPRESYVVFPSATSMSMRPLHQAKAPLPMLVTLEGMVMVVRLLQLKKASSPILTTPLGIVMAVRPMQSEKA